MFRKTVILITGALLAVLAILSQAYAATEFVCTIKQDGSGDYTILNSWAAANQCDLTTAFTAGWDTQAGSDIVDGTSVTWGTDGVGTLKHMTTVTKSGAATFLLVKTSGSDPVDNDVVTDGTNSFAVNGTPDSVIAVAKIDGAWTAADTTAVTISGWTTSATNYIRIYTTAAARHSGKWDEGKYRLYSGHNTAITVNEQYVRFDGLQIKNNLSYAAPKNGILLTPGAVSGVEIHISNCLIQDTNSYITESAIGIVYNLGLANAVVKLWNNIIYDYINASANGIYSQDTDWTVYAYNNTIFNCAVGYSVSSGVVIAKNNIAQNCTNGFSGTFNAASDYNLSDLAGDAPGANSKNSTNVAFVDEANDDFHLALTDTGAKDSGTDLSADANLPFSDDIDGQSRSGHTWDIGADEAAEQIYRSVGPGATTALAVGTSNALTISGSTATFASALPNNVGVGDAIEYDSDNTGTIDAICFIYSRTSSTEYTVKKATGAIPTATTAADNDWSVFRAYTSLALAETGTENTGINAAVVDFDTWALGKDIVASNEIWNIACYADAVDGTAVIIDGWTTGVDNYIRIYTPTSTSEVGASQRHSGKWDEGKYRLEVTTNRGIHFYENYVRIEGLQIKITISTVGTYAGVFTVNIVAGGSDIRISHNIIRGVISGAADYSDGIVLNDADITSAKIWNNLIYDMVGGLYSSAVRLSGINMYIYNNTIYNSRIGITKAPTATVYAKNNIYQSNSIPDADGFFGTFTSSDYNISDLVSDAPSPSYRSTLATTVAFVSTTAGSEDLRLAAADTAARNAGTDLSADSNLAFSDDIGGNTRIAPWDIGADEYAGVVGVSSTLADGSYKADQVIPITVTFSEAVTVTGTPQITLSTGSPATTAVDYTSGSGTTVLTFNYTVASGNSSADLDYAATTSLALNSGTINDAAGNAAALTLVSPGAAGSLGANKALVIDTTAPNAPVFGTFTALNGTVVANTLNSTNTGFTLSFTSPATEYAGTAHLYAGGSLLTNDVTVAVSAASTVYTLTGNAQSITDLGADGTKALTIKIIDTAGNVGAAATGASIVVTHTAGVVAPVTKSVTYGTVLTNLTGSNKCWITQNLGADQQATSATDDTEASAGWYWQFNRAQGFKHDGTTRTPSTTWITSINEASDWILANDPCDLLLGTGWRLPTYTEWLNADANGAWTGYGSGYVSPYDSVLKLHAAGYLLNDGTFASRGINARYNSSTQNTNTYSWNMYFGTIESYVTSAIKDYGWGVRCLSDDNPTLNITKDTTAPNAPTIGTFTATVGTVVANTLNSTNTGFTLSFTSPATEFAGTAHLYAGGSLLATDITTAVSAASTVYTLTGNAQSITDLGADGAKALTVKIIDAAGNIGTASSAANITKDVTVSTVAAAGVSSTLDDGIYKADQVIPITVTFSEAVTVTGTPQITLSTGSPATTAVNYTSGSGTTVLTFNYTVAAGNTSADLDYAATTSLALNSGTINDAAGNAATLTLAEPGAAGSLGVNKALVIDTTAPNAPTIGSFTALEGTVVANTLNNTNTGFTLGFTSPATEYAGTAHLYLAGADFTTPITTAVTLASTAGILTGNSTSITQLGADGTKALTIKIIDAAGNVGAAATGISSITVTHTAGTVAPVDKTVTYGTVLTNLTGSDKCWITRNLGASQQAISSTDATEASAGWYWQFNRQQGYKHDGTTRTPSSTWDATNDNTYTNWDPAKDPCTLLLGTGWRLPTSTEWTNADANGGWVDFDNDATGTFGSVLKLHAAGRLSSGDLYFRDATGVGNYWSSTQFSITNGYYLYLNSAYSVMYDYGKAIGFSVRCLSNDSPALNITKDTTAPNAPTIGSFTATVGTVVANTLNNTNTGFTLSFTSPATEYAGTAHLYLAGTDFTTPITTAVTLASTAGTLTGNSTSITELGADGAKALTVVIVDSAGNIGTASTAADITLDITAPNAPTIGSFTATVGTVVANTLNNTNTGFTLSFTSPATEYAGTAHLYLAGADFTTPITTAVTLASTAGTLTGTSTSITELGADGAKALTVVIVDSAGSIGTASTAADITLDITPPNAPTIGSFTATVGTVVANTLNNTNTGFTLSFTSPATEYAGTAHLYLAGTDFTTPITTAVTLASTAGTLTGNSTSITELGADGVKALTVKIVDAAGNIGAAPSSITINHTAGAVAPVTKSVTYGTVNTSLSGASKYWITQNLGADQQATSATDATEASAGWYWQFNRSQGYKHDGTTLTPAWTITSIDEASNWTLANDPCALLLGTGWRLPTSTEWTNADTTGAWTNYNSTYASVLKLHAAGRLSLSSGVLDYRGSYGYYRSSTQDNSTYGWFLFFSSSVSVMSVESKASGFSVRCLSDDSPALNITKDTTAPINQDTVFASNISKKAGDSVTIVSSGDATNNVWFAPSGTTSFVAGATMTTASGTATSILAPATEGPYKLFVIDAAGNISNASAATLTVDATAPTVAAAGVSSTLADGIYKADQVIPITVTFSEIVNVTGTPQITLSTGSPATTAINYTTGSGTTVLIFNYTVAAGNSSADLDYAATSSLALNSGTINDAVGNAATLTLAEPGAAGSLGANKALVIDTTAPNAPTIGTFTATVGTVVANTLNNTNTGFTLNFTSPATEFAGTAHLYLAGADFTTPITTAVTLASTAGTLTGNSTSITELGADGAKALTVVIVDSAGNIGTASTAADITLDITAPNAPTIGSFTALEGTITEGYLNSTNTGFTLSFTSPATEYAGTAHLYAGGNLLANDVTVAVSAASTVYTLTGNAQSIIDLGVDGAKALTVKIIDAAGNIGTASSAANITKDVTPPNAPTIGSFTATVGTVVANTLNNTNTGFTLSFTSPATEYAGTAHLYAGGNLLANDVTVAVSAASTVYTLTGNAQSIIDLGVDGAKALTVKIIDATGSVSIASAAANITLDTTPPNAPTIGSFTATVGTVVANTLNNTNTGFTLSFTSPATEYAGTAHLYVGGSLLATDITTAVSAASTVYSLTGNAQSITDLGADEAKALTVKIIDSNGSVSIASSAANITLDTTAPNAPTIGSFTATVGTVVANTLNNTNTGFTLSFTSPATEYAGTAHLYLAGADFTTPITTAVTLASTAGTLTGNSTSITELGADGAKALTVVIVDSAGNIGTTSSAANITKDVVSPINQDTVFTSDVSKQGGATVTIVSSGDATNNVWFAPNATTSFVAGATMTTASGTATLILAPATEGPYKLFIIDAAGNYSAPSTATLTVDNTAPTGSVTSNATTSGILKIGDSIVFTFTPGQVEAGATVTGLYNGVALVWSTANSGQTYTATYTVVEGQADQTSALQISGVTITDAAGNTSSAVAGTDVVKTIDANKPVFSSVIISSNNSNSLSYAKVGDVVTLTLTSNETIGQPAVAFTCGGSAIAGTVTYANPAGNTWTAQYTTDSIDTNGLIGFSVNFSDTAGNAGTTVSAVTDSSSVTFDKTAPSATVTIADAYYTTDNWDDNATINGTFSDNVGLLSGTGLKVSIKQEDGDIDHYWNGTNWDSITEQWNNATAGSNTWTYSLAKANLTAGREYVVTAKAEDTAGNITISSADSFVYTPILRLTRASGTGDVTAGATVELTITATDYMNNTIASYSGNKSLVFSGPQPAPNGTTAKVEGISIGTATTVNFISGVSAAGAATLTPYMAEPFSLDVQDVNYSTINSTASDAYDLDLTVIGAAYDHLEVTGTATMTAGGTNQLTVTAYDPYGNLTASYVGAKNLTFSGPGLAPNDYAPTVAGVSVGSPTSVTFTNGVASSLALVAYNAETTTVDVSDGIKSSTGNAGYDLDLTVNPAAVVSMSLTTQPSPTATSLVDFTTQPVVTLYDTYENICTNNSLRQVTLSAVLASDTATAGGGTLNGTLTVTASLGVVTYSGLDYTKAENIMLKAASTGLTTIYSDQIAVSPAAAASMSFTTQPSSAAIAGTDFTVQPVITLYDASSNVCTNDSATQITLSAVLASDTATAGGGTLNGTLTVTASLGVVTYSGLDYTKSENIKLKAVSGSLTTIYSDQIVVSPAATYKYTLNTPADITAGGSRAAYTITRYDQNDNLVTSGAETTYLYTTSTGANAAFYNAASEGTAIISIAIPNNSSSVNFWYYDEKAGDWAITVTDASPADGDAGINDATDTITVNPASAAKFKVTAGSSTMTAGGSLAVTITALDTYSNTDVNYDYDSSSPRTAVFSGADSSASPVTAPTFTDYGGTPRNLGVNTLLTFVDGVAATTMKLYNAETAHIKVTIGVLTTVDADDLDITVSSAAASKLTWGTQYAAGDKVVKNAPWNRFTVNVSDVYGNVASSSVNVTVTPTGGTVKSGSTSTVASSAGVATFTDFAVTCVAYPGSVTLAASALGLTSSAASNAVIVEEKYNITYTVKDSVSAAILSEVTLTVNDSLGANEYTQTKNGVFDDITLEYDTGGYTFQSAKDAYVTSSETKTPTSAEDGADGAFNNTISWIGYLTSLSEATADYQVKNSFVYLEPAYETDGTTLKSGTDTLNIRLWLERRGKMITNADINKMGDATVEVYDDGTGVWTTLTFNAVTDPGQNDDSALDESLRNGTYQKTIPYITTSGSPKLLSLTNGKTYFARCKIPWGGTSASSALRYTYQSGATFTITISEKLKEATDAIKAQVSGVQTLISAEAGLTREKVSEVKSETAEIKTATETTIPSKVAEVKTETAKILTAAETTIPAKVDETKTALTTEVVTSRKSEILNRENTVRSGQSLTIRYRTYTGLSPTIDVYDASNALKVEDAAMTEIGTTGIYEKTVTFESAWGRGDFSIVCSETTKGTMDAMTVSVLTTDMEQVYGQVSSILGNTSGITGLRTVADSLNNQFAVIESVLSKVGKNLVAQVKEAASSALGLESIFTQLANVAKQVKQISGEAGINLEKLYQVSVDKKQDIDYLKNKTQQLKASVEMSTKMVDNIANKPITQTWYEYKK